MGILQHPFHNIYAVIINDINMLYMMAHFMLFMFRLNNNLDTIRRLFEAGIFPDSRKNATTFE